MTEAAPPPGDAPAPLRITGADLDRAVLPAWPPAPPPRPARRSQLAVASLVLALLSVPLFGIFLGPLAVGCGVLALGALGSREDLTGGRIAVAGVLIGTLSIAGWGTGLALWLSRRQADDPSPPRLEEAAGPPAAGVADAPHHIRRALRANVLLRCAGTGGRDHAGSGIVVARDADGWIALTNLHVASCAQASRLTARPLGGEERVATRCWTGPDGVDAALVRVEGGDAPEPVPLGRHPQPRVGDAVFAVGNPLGFEATFTAGVLSAVRTGGRGGRALRVLQVQASVNPGSSGGGLYAADGGLLGVNTWIASEAVAGGIGFALSAEDLADLLAASPEPCARAALSHEAPIGEIP